MRSSIVELNWSVQFYENFMINFIVSFVFKFFLEQKKKCINIVTEMYKHDIDSSIFKMDLNSFNILR